MAMAALKKLSAKALTALISRDTFAANELTIFKAVEYYVGTAENMASTAELLEAVRLQHIPNSDLLNIVKPTGLFSGDTILNAMALKCHNDYKTRGDRGGLGKAY